MQASRRFGHVASCGDARRAESSRVAQRGESAPDAAIAAASGIVPGRDAPRSVTAQALGAPAAPPAMRRATAPLETAALPQVDDLVAAIRALVRKER